jgi:hypothetical protein
MLLLGVFWNKHLIVTIGKTMKQEASQKIAPRTDEIPDWIKKGTPDWFWIAVVISSLFLILVIFDGSLW